VINLAVSVVVGLQYGDEGKGKVVDYLSRDYDIVARYNGGDNAGHTLYRNGTKIALHLVPSGILERKICVIGNGVNINLDSLVREINEIQDKFGFDPLPYLYLSDRAHIILPQDIEASKGDGNSTGKGIGPSYARKASRKGIRLADLYNISDGVKEERFEVDGINRLVEVAQRFRHKTVNVSKFLHEARLKGQSILFEGAQGSGIDLDHGQYPYVTSSSCVSGGACTGIGIGPTRIDNVIGVAKVYTTRVDGNQESPFPTQLDSELETLLRECGNEFGATTGRPRRCGWFDLVQVNDAIIVNGADEIILTKLDVLDNLDEIKVCVAYEIDGTVVNDYPETDFKLRKIIPIYHNFNGWRGETTKAITNSDDLPRNALRYIEFLQSNLLGRIIHISIGPEAGEVIKLKST